jgi:hypothetical protein
VLTFVKNAVTSLVGKISDRGHDVDRDVFKELFSLPANDPGRRTSSGGEPGGDGPSGPERPRVPSEPAPFSISRLNNAQGNGFRVKPNPNVETATIPDYAIVRTGYVKPRGNPIKGYRNWHFNLADMTIESQSAEILAAGDNRMVVRVLDVPRFRVDVQGFDGNRDVAVAVEGVNESEATQLAGDLQSRETT